MSSLESQDVAIPFLAHPKPRPGQIDMIEDCTKALANRSFHLAAAPTGIGKTAASLAAALRVAKSSPEKKTVFFLTSRQSQHRIVVDTVRRINDRIHDGEKITLVDMIGQSGMCLQPFKDESPLVFSIMCSQARRTRSCQHWITKSERFSQRVLSSPLHVDELVDLAKIHTENGALAQPCPWKAARESVELADVFVGDYNHLFDDGVRSSSLEAMGVDLKNIIIVVDEAHNLPDRIRMTMERRLTQTIVRNSVMEVEEYEETMKARYMATGGEMHAEEYEVSQWCLAVMRKLREQFANYFHRMLTQTPDDSEVKIEIEDITNLIHTACDMAEGITGQKKLGEQTTGSSFVDRSERLKILSGFLQRVEVDMDVGEGEDPMEPDSHRLAMILDIIKRFGNTPALTLIYDTKGKDGRITSHLLDPGLVAGEVFTKSAGAVLMSGTLYPPDMYANLLGIPGDKSTSRAYESPFAGERRPVLVAKDVTTRYNERSAQMDDKIRAHVQCLLDGTPGNVAVFVPSYAMLNNLFADAWFNGARKLVESRDWSKSDVDGVVEKLRHAQTGGERILLCGVFGARLSEGVDYNGGILDAVACVGIPNAPPSVLSDSLKEYAASRFGRDKAWRYTVTQPAINAILQAMGRPIRSIGDRALILLLDKRHNDRTYVSCYPHDLRMNATNDPQTTKRFARRFFSKVHTEFLE